MKLEKKSFGQIGYYYNFRDELTALINCHSKESASNTPDFILAEYLVRSLDAFDGATKARSHWYGHEKREDDVLDCLVPDSPTCPRRADVQFSPGGTVRLPFYERPTMAAMRAKMQVNMVQEHFCGPDKAKSQETLSLHCVCPATFDKDGLSDDNTFAKFSPGGNLSLNVANPALFGQFKVGQKFYLDFTEAPE